jgi:hypothetical protein
MPQLGGRRTYRRSMQCLPSPSADLAERGDETRRRYKAFALGVNIGGRHLTFSRRTQPSRGAEWVAGRLRLSTSPTPFKRKKARFSPRHGRLAGDTVYGAVRPLKWLVDRKITPHIPVWDKSTRSDGTFSRADFVFDRERNVYICPGGKLLHTTGTLPRIIVLFDGITLHRPSQRKFCNTFPPIATKK